MTLPRAVVRGATFLAPLAVLFLLWPILIRAFDVNPRVFPDLPAVALAGLETLRDGTLVAHVGASLGRVVVGTVLAILVSVPLGVAMGVSPVVSSLLTPLFRFFSVLAGIAWIPIATLWFGYGFGAITFVIFNAVFFIVAYNTLLGVSTIPMPVRNAAASLGAGRWAMLTRCCCRRAAEHRHRHPHRPRLCLARLIAAEMIATNVGPRLHAVRRARLLPDRGDRARHDRIGAIWLLNDRLLLAPLLSAAPSSAGAWSPGHEPRPASLGLYARWTARGPDSRPRPLRAVHRRSARLVASLGVFRAPSSRVRPRSREGLSTYLQGHPAGLSRGFRRAVALGAAFGWRSGSARHPDRPRQTAYSRALGPIVLFFQAIGDIAWLPILLIWFGFGLTTMTFVIVYTVIFPVVFNTVLGVRSVPRDLPRAALSLGAPRWRVLTDVILPGALPNIVTGLRNGLGYGWRALIAAEIIVGTSGIGFLMFDARRAGSAMEIVLGMIVLGLLWYAVDAWVLAPIERATGQRWGLVTRT
jgi:NitT/TauT family transport system permease protein/taurine transport system permease protein